MDADAFDALVKTVVTPVGRRRVVGAAVGGMLAAIGIRRGPAAARKVCRLPGAACGRADDCCGRAACRGRRCVCPAADPGCGATCRATLTAGGYAAEGADGADFGGRPLSIAWNANRTSDKAGSFALEARLGGDLVLAVSADGDVGAARWGVTLRYGPVVTGLREARLDNDDGRLTGRFDGRAIVPLPTASALADPNRIRFEDGGPPPVVGIDPDLGRAVEQLIRRLGNQSTATCLRGRSRAEVPTESPLAVAGIAAATSWLGPAPAAALPSAATLVCTEASNACLACYFGCDTVLIACSAGCGWFGPFALLCIAGCWETHQEVCIAGCDGGACCPVECGSDFPNSCCCEGQSCCDGTCCAKGKVCTLGVCCSPGQQACGSKCCAAGKVCAGFGLCCAKDVVACEGRCCKADETCTGGICCTRGHEVCAGACCPDKADACQDDVCCAEARIVCDGVCCPKGSVCKPDDLTGETVCCPPDRSCGSVCCEELSACFDPEKSSCCSIFSKACGKTCCFVDEECIKDACCPSGQACGKRCCPTDNFCADKKDEKCKPCPEGNKPCPLAIAGAPNCCPAGAECCGNGKCCGSSTPCCPTDAGGFDCSSECLPA